MQIIGKAIQELEQLRLSLRLGEDGTKHLTAASVALHVLRRHAAACRGLDDRKSR